MGIYKEFSGIVTEIADYQTQSRLFSGCTKLFTVKDKDGQLMNFIVAPNTFVYDYQTIKKGDLVTGYYDSLGAATTIYPPQKRVIVLIKENPEDKTTVIVDYFTSNLLNLSSTLKLNIGPDTKIYLTNYQTFTGSIKNRRLVVEYGVTTFSIPPQTTPSKIIVLC